MKRKILMMCLATCSLLALGDNKPTLTVDGTTIDRDLVRITFDNDLTILEFDDGDTWEVDMASVAVSFAYDEDETPTGIADEGFRMKNEEGTTDSSSSVFDLQGRRLSTLTAQPSHLKKGIYIQNGKKVIIK